MHTAESNFSNFVIEYLGEIETEFENTSARWVRIMKKKLVVEIPRHTPFKGTVPLYYSTA